MKVVVCVKYFKGEINPFDASALECALQMEKADVTVITMAPPGVSQQLRQLTRLGIKRTILLTDPIFKGSDTLATSYILSLAIKRLQPDLVLCGRQSIDGDTAQVGPSLAVLLQYSIITNVMEVQAESCVTRLGKEALNYPAVLTMERFFSLRFPSIRSKMGEIEIWNADTLCADPNRCGCKGSPTKVLETYESQIGRRNCTFIHPKDLLPLIQTERNRGRMVQPIVQSAHKIDEIWVVGEELKETAGRIAQKVTLISCETAADFALKAQREKPKVILWPSNLWGKKIAPQVAAILQTGLCADCIQLETDGEKLYMYRPAFGGSLMAKIECKTVPQMATIRTKEFTKEDVIVAGGKGAKEDILLLQILAKRINAIFGASRGLVDMGLASYEMQIGLTGRSISPHVYIALGISGSVQHTCAIEGANTVIAINKNKDARIFDYADYGIVGEIKGCLEGILWSLN